MKVITTYGTVNVCAWLSISTTRFSLVHQLALQRSTAVQTSKGLCLLAAAIVLHVLLSQSVRSLLGALLVPYCKTVPSCYIVWYWGKSGWTPHRGQRSHHFQRSLSSVWARTSSQWPVVHVSMEGPSMMVWVQLLEWVKLLIALTLSELCKYLICYYMYTDTKGPFTWRSFWCVFDAHPNRIRLNAHWIRIGRVHMSDNTW